MEVKPGYKQTEVGVIPEEWEVMPLANSSEPCNSGSAADGQGTRDTPFSTDGIVGSVAIDCLTEQ